MNTELNYTNKSHWWFWKRQLFQSFTNNLYRTHLISSNNKRDVCSKMTPPFFFKVTDTTCVHGSPQQVWPPLSERHSMQHWLVERTRVWRVYSATPAAGHGWAGTRQQGWGSFLLLVVQKLTGAKSGEWAAKNLWWPELCEEWAARNLWWPELCEERHCCHAKCGTWSHGLQSTLDEGTHNLIPAA